MRTSKIIASVIFASSFAVPALAQTARDPSTISKQEAETAASQAVQSMPATTGGGAYDYGSIRVTKKEYLDQLGKSFDTMDANGDGIVEGAELMKGQPGLSGNAGYGRDITDAAARAKDSPSDNSSAPAGGVAPINAQELGQ